MPVDGREPPPVGAPLSDVSGTFVRHEDPVLLRISKVGRELLSDTCNMCDLVSFNSVVHLYLG